MEFERSMFHIHERFMSSSSTKTVLVISKWITLFLTVITGLHFYAYHKIYVNKSEILQTAIEQQLLFMRTEAYRNLPYSDTNGGYGFCNKKTFS